METCWFCKTCLANPRAALKVHMRGKKIGTTKTGFKEYTTSYEGRVVLVPRCKECESHHHTMRKGRVFPIILGTMGTICALSAFTYFYDAIKLILIILSSVLTLTFVLMFVRLGLITRGTAPEWTKAEYPAVKELLKQGWHLGL